MQRAEPLEKQKVIESVKWNATQQQQEESLSGYNQFFLMEAGNQLKKRWKTDKKEMEVSDGR